MDLLSIHTSTYLFYAISLNMLPNRAKSFFTVSLPYTAHDVTSRDRLDAIFLPFARYHTSWLLFAFAARNSSLSSFSWHIQEYPYPLFNDVIAILRFECILYRSLLSGKEIFAFLFRYCSYHFRESQSGKPALTGGLHPNAHFSFPGTLGQVRPEPPLECHCTVSLLFFTRIVFGCRILH